MWNKGRRKAAKTIEKPDIFVDRKMPLI